MVKCLYLLTHNKHVIGFVVNKLKQHIEHQSNTKEKKSMEEGTFSQTESEVEIIDENDVDMNMTLIMTWKQMVNIQNLKLRSQMKNHINYIYNKYEI